jgi:hypothetical protein
MFKDIINMDLKETPSKDFNLIESNGWGEGVGYFKNVNSTFFTSMGNVRIPCADFHKKKTRNQYQYE